MNIGCGPAGEVARRPRRLGGPGRLRGSVALWSIAFLVVAGVRPAAAQETVTGQGGSGLTSFGEADFDWRVRPLGGEATTLEAFQGKVLLINLWASWCTPCVREMASMERLRQRLSDTGVEFLIVATEGERTVRRFLRRYPYDLPIFLEERPIPPAFGAVGIPTSWVVDRRGRIVLRHHGEAVWDSEEVEDLLRHLDG